MKTAIVDIRVADLPQVKAVLAAAADLIRALAESGPHPEPVTQAAGKLRLVVAGLNGRDARPMPAGLVAVWDASDPGWLKRHAVRSRWLREHGLPADQMYRAEFFQDSGGVLSVRIFCYALNSEGRKYLGPEHNPQREHDHEACAPAKEPPRTIPLSELPPASLLAG